jgi:hypothetical protein
MEERTVMTSKLRIWALSVACAAFIGACDEKKDAKKDEPAAGSTAAATGATATPAASGAATGGAVTPATSPAGAAQSAGAEVLKYMPSDCPMGRIYANLSGLFTGDAAGNWAAFQRQIASMSSDADAQTAMKVATVLKEGGLAEGSLREIAVCLNKDESKIVAAVGIDSAKVADPLGLIAKAIEAAGKPAPEKGDEGGVPYLQLGKAGKGFLAMVQPNVAVMVDNKAMIATAKAGGGAGGFGEATKHAVWVDVTPDPDTKVAATLTDKGTSYDARLAAKLPARQTAAMKEKPDEFAKGIKAELEKLAGQLGQGPFKIAGDKMKQVELKVEGDQLVATLNITKDEIAALTKTISETKPEDLVRALR